MYRASAGSAEACLLPTNAGGKHLGRGEEPWAAIDWSALRISLCPARIRSAVCPLNRTTMGPAVPGYARACYQPEESEL